MKHNMINTKTENFVGNLNIDGLIEYIKIHNETILVNTFAGTGKTAAFTKLMSIYSNISIMECEEELNDEKLFIKKINSILMELDIETELKRCVLIIDQLERINNEQIYVYINRLIKDNKGLLQIIAITNDVISDVFVDGYVKGDYILIEGAVFNDLVSLADLNTTQLDIYEETGRLLTAFNYCISHKLGSVSGLMSDSFFVKYIERNICKFIKYPDIKNTLSICHILREFEENLILNCLEQLHLRNNYFLIKKLQLVKKKICDNNSLYKELVESVYELTDILRQGHIFLPSEELKIKVCELAMNYSAGRSRADLILYYASNSPDSNALLYNFELYARYLLNEDKINRLGIPVRKLEGIINLHEKFSPKLCGLLGQYFYFVGEYQKMEKYLNYADMIFGKENEYSSYRKLYNSLILLKKGKDANQSAYENLSEAVFFFKENNLELPALKTEDLVLLNEMVAKGQSRHRRIEVKFMGDFTARILPDNVELGWRTKKSAELFAYLVNCNGRMVERRKLLEMLWVEIPDNAITMLHNMIYSIRKRLAVFNMDNAIVYKDKKYTVDMSLVHSEISTIEKLEQLAETGKNSEIIKYINVIDSFSGKFLENIDSLWADERRNQLDNTLRKLHCIMAQKFLEERDYDNARIRYHKALKIDPYSEELMEKYIQICTKKGDWKHLKSEYERYKENLKNDLGIEPSEQLKILAEGGGQL